VAAPETRQIALNLLLNACEVSTPGSEVGFSAAIEHDADGFLELSLTVTDAGPGLPSQVARALTEENAADAVGSWDGLGLHVIRDLVHSLGGRVAIAPHAPGASIIVHLPARAQIRKVAAA
jgi:signal transduction histidine kinase